jgi:membrane-associated PAP2 superfamily phosphatase
MPWPAFILFILVTSLPGIVAAIVTWLTIRKTQKNSWAVAIITGFAILALFIALTPLLGSWIAYVALLPIAIGLLFANSRMLSGDRLIVFKFSLLFIVCAALWLFAHVFAVWIFRVQPM